MRRWGRGVESRRWWGEWRVGIDSNEKTLGRGKWEEVLMSIGIPP